MKPVASASVQGGAMEVFRVFLRLGLTAFGGPVAHIGHFRQELVARRRWVSDAQFTQLFAICQFLPGPASSQLGFSLGLIRAGGLGALAAFVGFTLPSALLMLGLATVLPHVDGPLAAAAIQGLKIVAFAVVADAVWGMVQKLCPDTARRVLAVLAAAVLIVGPHAGLPLLVVAAGGLFGVICGGTFQHASVTAPVALPALLLGPRQGVLLLLVCGVGLFLLPALAGDGPGLLALAAAFYQAGALVFGGGHVVLPLLEQSVVASGWISPESFLAGYGAAQAIPGPMFAFAAYLGGVIPQAAGPLAGAMVALLAMFLPGFLLVAGVLPLWQRLSHRAGVVRAVAGVNAAVVGVLGAALYDPIFTAAVVRPVDLAIGLCAWALLAIARLSALWVVLFAVLARIGASFF